MVLKKEDGSVWVNSAYLALGMVIHAVVVVVFIFTTFATKEELRNLESRSQRETTIILESIKDDIKDIKDTLKERR